MNGHKADVSTSSLGTRRHGSYRRSCIDVCPNRSSPIRYGSLPRSSSGAAALFVLVFVAFVPPVTVVVSSGAVAVGITIAVAVPRIGVAIRGIAVAVAWVAVTVVGVA